MISRKSWSVSVGEIERRIYKYMCVCVRETERYLKRHRELDRQKENKSERERDRQKRYNQGDTLRQKDKYKI
jgi:hypothetical protein